VFYKIITASCLHRQCNSHGFGYTPYLHCHFYPSFTLQSTGSPLLDPQFITSLSRSVRRLCLERHGTCSETRFCLSMKQTSPF